MKLKFAARSDLPDCEWDPQNPRWKRPDIDPEVLKALSQRSTLNGLARVGLMLCLLVERLLTSTFSKLKKSQAGCSFTARMIA